MSAALCLLLFALDTLEQIGHLGHGRVESVGLGARASSRPRRDDSLAIVPALHRGGEPSCIAIAAYNGAGAIILPGVRIGAGALVGALSLVRHDVSAGTRVAGVPARELGPGIQS
ncbi:MAG: hypothetical protein ABI054_10200 [Planctomycetota bacterium]